MKRTGPTDKARSLLRTHLWLVLLATCMSVGAAVAAVGAKPVTYTATAEVVVSPTQTDSNPIQPDMGTERAIAESGVVVHSGAEALSVDDGTVRKSLSVSVVPQTWVLRISYTASTPDAAYSGATALATSYVDYRDRERTTSAATLVTRPAVPASGSRGSLPLFLVLGLVAGLTVGVVAAWLWDRVSDRVRSGAELRQLTGLTVLTRMRRWDSRRDLLPPEGPARESLAFVAARLSSMTGLGGGRTIVVTSPRSGAGTTSVACGTAAALAAQGKRVVLIAARGNGLRPEEVLGVATSPGLSQVLSRGCSPDLALHPTGVRNLSVVPTGGEPGDGLELADLHLVLKRLAKGALVVIDAPPVLTSADALLLADVADLVVLVGDLRSGTRTDVRDAMALLDEVGPRLAGWVANLPPPRRRRARPSGGVDGELGEGSRPVTAAMRPESDRTRSDAGRPATAAMKARPRPGTPPPGAPRTETPPRDGVRPVRAPAAVARRR